MTLNNVLECICYSIYCYFHISFVRDERLCQNITVLPNYICKYCNQEEGQLTLKQHGRVLETTLHPVFSNSRQARDRSCIINDGIREGFISQRFYRYLLHMNFLHSKRFFSFKYLYKCSEIFKDKNSFLELNPGSSLYMPARYHTTLLNNMSDVLLSLNPPVS